MGIKCRLDETKKLELIRSPCLPWKYYLEAYAYLLHKMAFSDNCYGRRSNPDPSDLEQCVYLFWSGYYVTEDRVFLGFLRRLGKLRKYPIKVMNYSEFKQMLYKESW